MSRRDERLALRHMLDHAREAVEMAAGRSRPDLDADRMFALALVRLMEIVGEAGARPSAAFRERYPRVPWGAIIGLRNRLIHGYDVVDYDIVWRILEKDMPPLIAELSRILAEDR